MLAFAALVIVIALASWYTASHSSTPKSTSSLLAGWSQFKSDKYGFGFNYPSNWGKPQATATSGKTGSHYQVNFSPDLKSKSTNHNLMVSINMDSSDYNSGACSSPACSASALTSKTVQNNLKRGGQTFTRHDSSSYVFVSTLPASGFTSMTNVQVVNLTKIKVSAVVALYTLTGIDASQCPAGKFAPPAQPQCINSNEYADLNQVLKSLQGA